MSVPPESRLSNGSSPNTGSRLSSGARAGILAAAALLLLGVALAAGGLGSWVARPVSGPGLPRARRTLRQVTPPSDTLTSSTDHQRRSVEFTGVGWVLSLVLITFGAIVLILLARWLYGRFKEYAGRHTAGVGIELTGGFASFAQHPPPVLENEAGRHFDPRQAADAIISCWLWVEKAAASIDCPRQQQDTATEFLYRFVQQDRSAEGRDESARRSAAAVLLPLYQRARFDQVALTADAATQARAAADVLCSRVRAAGAFRNESAAAGSPEAP